MKCELCGHEDQFEGDTFPCKLVTGDTIRLCAECGDKLAEIIVEA